MLIASLSMNYDMFCAEQVHNYSMFGCQCANCEKGEKCSCSNCKCVGCKTLGFVHPDVKQRKDIISYLTEQGDHKLKDIDHLPMTELLSLKDKVIPPTQVIFVGADWCVMCKKALPQFEPWFKKTGWRVSKKDNARIKIANYDDNKDYYNSLGINELPKLIVMKKGKIRKIVSYTNKEDMAKLFEY